MSWRKRDQNSLKSTKSSIFTTFMVGGTTGSSRLIVFDPGAEGRGSFAQSRARGRASSSSPRLNITCCPSRKEIRRSSTAHADRKNFDKLNECVFVAWQRIRRAG